MDYNLVMAPEDNLSETEAKQRAYYDSISETYDQHYGSEHNIAYREQILQDIFADESLQGAKVLDAMCGGGQNSAFFISRGCQVTGVDISENQCEHYIKRFPGASVLCASALETGLEDNSFDFVFTDSLHHLHPHVKQGVAEFHRVLRPGGALVVWEPSAGSVVDHARKLWYRLDKEYFEDNEASIDIARLAAEHSGQFELEDAIYGGNLGYVFVVLSMAMRIPVRWVDRYAPALLRAERALTPFQRRVNSLWVLARLRKVG